MKKFIKKMIKKTEGFTLVELIVVIAILGILAGIAVPAYSGYLKKANEAADITTLDAVKTAVVAATATQPASVTKIEVDTTDGKITAVTVTSGTGGYSGEIMANTTTIGTDYDTYVGSQTLTLKSEKYKGGATWTATADATTGENWNKG